MDFNLYCRRHVQAAWLLRAWARGLGRALNARLLNRCSVRNRRGGSSRERRERTRWSLLAWCAILALCVAWSPKAAAQAGPCPVNNRVCSQTLAYQLCRERTVEYANGTGNPAIKPGTCTPTFNSFTCHANISGTPNAGACSHPAVYYYDPGVSESNTPGPPDCNENCFGDPINAGNGNKLEHHVEYGVRSSPLAFSWDYNSIGVARVAVEGDVLGKRVTTVLSRALTITAVGAQQVAAISQPTESAGSSCGGMIDGARSMTQERS